ncbi:MAG: hypothetical protein GEV09_01970 [Pseudonocardiaceae bacterium]|nr:hypothetical protein [Pseudonocardiaceae bacterium]
MSPEQRSQRARIAALARWAHEDPTANAARAQAGLRRKFENEVDPDRVLPEAERARRTECAWRAHLARAAFASAKARRARSGADE